MLRECFGKEAKCWFVQVSLRQLIGDGILFYVQRLLLPQAYLYNHRTTLLNPHPFVEFGPWHEPGHALWFFHGNRLR